MQKCLGIYVEENLIKYAKVSKEKDDIRVETFGVRFYEDINTEIKKIVEETFSFNTPISVNLNSEKYLYFDIFALLNKKDLEKAIKTEFTTYCDENKYNENAFETRYALMQNKENKDKIRAMNIYINKIEMNRQLQPFEKYRVSTAMPVSIAIGNIANLNKKENQLIVNMEATTTLTTVIEQQIYEIGEIEAGSKEILATLNRIENSYAKAYDICKNTTIYTADVNATEEQPHLQYIMPTVYKIAQAVQEIVNLEQNKYQTVYLTGTLATINNIDLYFQEFLQGTECKILRPKFFDETNMKINIKEYIEVNSAIALAVNGIGEGMQGLNFSKNKIGGKLNELLRIDMPSKRGEEAKQISLIPKLNINMDFGTAFSRGEVWLLRTIMALVLTIVIFAVFSKMLTNSMISKEEEIEGLKIAENAQISIVQSNAASLNTKKAKYDELIADLKAQNEKISDIAARRNSIPNLLNQIMFSIPDKVQLLSIENTTERKIVIKAQAANYEQLGMFIVALKTKGGGILKKVVSSNQYQSEGIIIANIEGELP